MKDEEMADKHAEEYRKNFRYYRAWHGQVVDKSPSTIVEQSFKDGFLAGLKAGRPKWHDLRKDPNDLPKEVGNYLVCYIDTMLNRNVFILEFVDFLEDSHWIDETSHEIEKFDEGVIAWCEIPEFEEAAV